MPLQLINKNDRDAAVRLDRQESLQLELVFNKSSKGKQWSHIGDVLYNFSIKGGAKDVLLTKEEFDFLFQLYSR